MSKPNVRTDLASVLAANAKPWSLDPRIVDALMEQFDIRTRGTVTDAEVEAAAQALFEDPLYDARYTWAEMVTEDPSRADIWRADARRVLKAAREARS